jgi:hypothetical protein
MAACVPFSARLRGTAIKFSRPVVPRPNVKGYFKIENTFYTKIAKIAEKLSFKPLMNTYAH